MLSTTFSSSVRLFCLAVTHRYKALACLSSAEYNKTHLLPVNSGEAKFFRIVHSSSIQPLPLVQTSMSFCRHHIASGSQSPGALLATVLECVWRCVALNRKNLARFLVLEGLGLLLQLLEGSRPEIWPGLLSCLADVTENPKVRKLADVARCE